MTDLVITLLCALPVAMFFTAATAELISRIFKGFSVILSSLLAGAVWALLLLFGGSRGPIAPGVSSSDVTAFLINTLLFGALAFIGTMIWSRVRTRRAKRKETSPSEESADFDTDR